MSHFPDTSFLCAIYRTQIHSAQADAFFLTNQPLRVSTLLLLEFRQSTRFQVRLQAKDLTKGFSQHEGNQMLRALQNDLAMGILEVAPVDWPDVHRIAERLSATYTGSEGHRLVDIMHVATALHLGAAEFFTFDANQQRLAEAEGMTVPV